MSSWTSQWNWKNVEYESDGDTNFFVALGTITKGLLVEQEGLKIRRRVETS